MDGGGGSDGSIIPSASRRGADLGRPSASSRRSTAAPPWLAPRFRARSRSSSRTTCSDATASARRRIPSCACCWAARPSSRCASSPRSRSARSRGARSSRCPTARWSSPSPSSGCARASPSRSAPRTRWPRCAAASSRSSSAGPPRQPGQRHHHRLLRLGRLHLPAGDRSDGSPPGRAALHQRATAARHRGRGELPRERADHRPRGHGAGADVTNAVMQGQANQATQVAQFVTTGTVSPLQLASPLTPTLSPSPAPPSTRSTDGPVQRADPAPPQRRHDAAAGRRDRRPGPGPRAEDQRARQSRLRVRSDGLDAERRRWRRLEPRLHHGTRGPEHGPDPHGHGRARSAPQPPVPAPRPANVTQGGRVSQAFTVAGGSLYTVQVNYNFITNEFPSQFVDDIFRRADGHQPLRHHHPARAGEPPDVHASSTSSEVATALGFTTSAQPGTRA